MKCRAPEIQLACFRPTDAALACLTILHVTVYDDDGAPVAAYYQDDSGAIIDPATYLGGGAASVGACESCCVPVNTCYLPDQYAIVWAWKGSGADAGAVQAYDPLTDTWTDYGQLIVDGVVVGGYALAFKNDATDPLLYYQVAGKLYQATPDNPTAGKLVGPANNSAFAGSYPCLAFDPSGRLLVGIGSGSSVGEIDPNTGAVTTLGTLIDVRDGAPLSAGPGDWFFDPNGRWFLMARDLRGATFGVSTGTVLWEINPSTLAATRVGLTEAPVFGTGAAWYAAGRYLLSTGTSLYAYNHGADVAYPTPAAWELLTNAAPHTINDLANQWVIPDPIPVFGYLKGDCNNPDDCEDSRLFSYQQDETTLELRCVPFVPTVPGTWGKCSKNPNPYVSDPFSESGGGSAGCETCPDEVWQEGCSDAGFTMYRRYYDAAGNPLVQYLYGSLAAPVSEPPSGFQPIKCGAGNTSATVTPWCDSGTSTTIYRKEYIDGSVVWFDATGEIPEPAPGTVEAGECSQVDPNTSITEQVVCHDGVSFIRRYRENLTPNADGLLEPVTYQIVWYNDDGVFYDSGVIPTGDPVPAPPGDEPEFYVGDCVDRYIDYRFEKLCEIDDRKLLLVDSGGAFAEYSFYDGSVTPIPIPVPSAGSGADPDKFLLYAVAGSNLLTIDVNTKQQLSSVPLFTNDGSPTTFSAAHFFDGVLYGASQIGGPWYVFAINVATGEVSAHNGPWSGISGTGTSMAINPIDGKFYITGSGGTVYEVGAAVGASGAATLIYDSPGNIANGATFDTEGNLYLTGGPNTYMIENFPAGPESIIIDNWTPAANSITYYRTKASSPPCFFRKFGVTPDGEIEKISDHWVSDGSARTVAGAITCCDCGDCGSPGASTPSGPTAQQIGAEVESQNTYKGPTATEIADAMVLAERNSLTGHAVKFTGGGVSSLPVPAGARGNLIAIVDTGSGLVYFRLDGGAPTNTAGPERGEITGQYLSHPIRNVDLSLVRVQATSAAGDITVFYEVYV